ncbi:DUF4097 domain-containing protein [Planctomycetota bacterium]
MRNNHFIKVLPAGLLCLLMLTVGSCIHIDGSFWHPQVKHERTVELSAPLAPGSDFTAQTHNGYIYVNGAETEECSVTATITGRAENDEDALRIAEETQVNLESTGARLSAKIKKPDLARRQSVSVDLDVTVPHQTDLGLETHNGAFEIVNIVGDVDGVTHNGRVKIEQITGDIEMQTHNGSFYCREVSGDMELVTHNGKVQAVYAESAPPVCDVSIVSHNGSLDLTTPTNFSADVTVSTHNGSISTDLPLTITGKFGKRKINGTIGDGQGNLHLETHNGSIKIR